VPTVILSGVSDERAKEISLADNARYGVDDTLKLTELLGELDTAAIENIMPWSAGDIAALTASLAIDVEDLDLDEPTLPDQDDGDSEPLPARAPKTHQVLRFRCRSRTPRTSQRRSEPPRSRKASTPRTISRTPAMPSPSCCPMEDHKCRFVTICPRMTRTRSPGGNSRTAPGARTA
jgi:hypothetical protein